MRLIVFWLLTFFLAAAFQPASAQTITMESPKASSKSWRYENIPFPSGIQVRTLEGEKLELKIHDALTLVHVWNTKGGGVPEQWMPFSDLYHNYTEKGLRVYSVNFENAMGGRAQRAALVAFFEKNFQPKEAFYDAMGYSPDLLHVGGFPTYYLVDPDGTIVFRTNGWDKEGMTLLEQEIGKRLRAIAAKKGAGGD